jgi:HEPN domain-containing protein
MGMKERKKEAARWMAKAESDLSHAVKSLGMGDYDWAQFAAQQSSEKALKAVCILKGFGLLKIHDLTTLARKLDAPRVLISDAAILNPFSTISRYPDADEYLEPAANRRAAEDAILSAKNVLEWCKKKM